MSAPDGSLRRRVSAAHIGQHPMGLLDRRAELGGRRHAGSSSADMSLRATAAPAARSGRWRSKPPRTRPRARATTAPQIAARGPRHAARLRVSPSRPGRTTCPEPGTPPPIRAPADGRRRIGTSIGRPGVSASDRSQPARPRSLRSSPTPPSAPPTSGRTRRSESCRSRPRRCRARSARPRSPATAPASPTCSASSAAGRAGAARARRRSRPAWTTRPSAGRSPPPATTPARAALITARTSSTSASL